MDRPRRRSRVSLTPATLNIDIPSGADVIAVAVDGYVGVTAATANLFADTIAPPPDLEPQQVAQLAELLLAKGTRHFVLSGWSPSRFELAHLLAGSGARVDGVWHGNYLQTSEDYGWEMFQRLVAAAREGVITKVGVVKAGMETWLERLGVASGLLLNYVADIPPGPGTPEEGGPHLGMWLVAEGYRKLPYAMIAGAGMTEDAQLAGSGVSQRAVDFARFVGLDTTRLLRTSLPRPAVLSAIGRTHLSLYVTQSESAPMLPLESMSLGVPCLIGPNSHLFADDDFLSAALIVPYPDHAEVIARYIGLALSNRTEIVDAYRKYAPGYIEKARRSVRQFVE